MALKRPPSAIEFTFRVEMQHYSCDVTPVGANEDAADAWFKENDPEGVAFVYPLIGAEEE
jgi:hypothetical protein